MTGPYCSPREFVEDAEERFGSGDSDWEGPLFPLEQQSASLELGEVISVVEADGRDDCAWMAVSKKRMLFADQCGWRVWYDLLFHPTDWEPLSDPPTRAELQEPYIVRGLNGGLRAKTRAAKTWMKSRHLI